MKNRTFFTCLALVAAMSMSFAGSASAEGDEPIGDAERKFWGYEPTTGIPLCLGGQEYLTQQYYVFWIAVGYPAVIPTGNSCP